MCRNQLNDSAMHADGSYQGMPRYPGIIVSIAGIITMSILMGFVVDLVRHALSPLLSVSIRIITYSLFPCHRTLLFYYWPRKAQKLSVQWFQA